MIRHGILHFLQLIQRLVLSCIFPEAYRKSVYQQSLFQADDILSIMITQTVAVFMCDIVPVKIEIESVLSIFGAEYLNKGGLLFSCTLFQLSGSDCIDHCLPLLASINNISRKNYLNNIAIETSDITQNISIQANYLVNMIIAHQSLADKHCCRGSSPPP